MYIRLFYLFIFVDIFFYYTKKSLSLVFRSGLRLGLCVGVVGVLGDSCCGCGLYSDSDSESSSSL